MLLNTKLTMINSIIVEDEPIFQEVLHKAIKASGLPVAGFAIPNVTQKSCLQNISHNLYF